MGSPKLLRFVVNAQIQKYVWDVVGDAAAGFKGSKYLTASSGAYKVKYIFLPWKLSKAQSIKFKQNANKPLVLALVFQCQLDPC